MESRILPPPRPFCLARNKKPRYTTAIMRPTLTYTATVKMIPESSEVEILATITTESFASYEPSVMDKIKDSIALPGFRKGHVPEALAKNHLGDNVILDEMAEAAIREAYPKIVEEHKLEPLARPEVTLTKIARGNPLEFKIRVALLPRFELPDYQSIAKNILLEPTVVSDKEVAASLEELRKRAAHMDKLASAKEKDTAAPTGETPEADLPTLDDTFAQHIAGVPTLAELTEKVRAGIHAEKELRAKSTRRAKIIEAILEKTTIPLPGILIESEANILVAEMKNDIERMGMRFSNYLTHAKKTEPEMREELRPDAERRARGQLLLNAIAEARSIVPDTKKLESEVKRIIDAHPDADRGRVIAHVATQLVNEQVLVFLETGAESSTESLQKNAPAV